MGLLHRPHRPRSLPLHDACQRGGNHAPGRQRAGAMSVMRAGHAAAT